MADGPRWKRRKQANPRRNHGESPRGRACPCVSPPADSAPLLLGTLWVRECGNNWMKVREAAVTGTVIPAARATRAPRSRSL